MNEFTDSRPSTAQKTMVIPATQMAAKIAAPASTATTIMATRSAVQRDVERHDGVHEHHDRLKEPSELTQTEVGDDHLEQRVAGPDEHEVEVPVADQLRQQVEVANGQLGDRERDAGDAVEERDFLHAPAAELRHVVEDDEDRDEVEERDEEDAQHVERERRPVLPLGTYASRDEPDVESQ